MNECSSCGKEVSRGHTQFKCPKCSGVRIIRCKSCRALGTAYACSKCNFVGP